MLLWIKQRRYNEDMEHDHTHTHTHIYIYIIYISIYIYISISISIVTPHFEPRVTNPIWIFPYRFIIMK